MFHIELKTAGRAGEVHAGEIRARERGVADRGAGAVDEVDHARREARLLEELHQEVRRVGRGACGLPDDCVAHQRGARGEVRADRGEVERRDGEDEALERPVLHPVPDALRGDRLLLVDPRHELDVEAVEVDHLAGGVDLRLVRRLRLAEHRGGVQRRAPRAGEQLRGPEEDGRSLLPRQARPVLPGIAGGLDRALDLARAALVDIGQDVALLVRHHDLGRVAGGDLLAADHERELDALRLHLVEARGGAPRAPVSPARSP